MKQNLILLIILSACFAGCKNETRLAEIKGEIKGLASDTIYLYGDDEYTGFIEPIVVTNNKFSYSRDIDTTIVQTRLFINDENQYPIYLERGKTIQIKGDTATLQRLEVKGTVTNEALTAFNKTLPPPAAIADTLTLRLVGEYIHQNQKSLINLYLLDKYFVQTSSPDLPKIKELIKIMDGALQDTPYAEQLIAWIEESEKTEVEKIVPSFTLPNAEGKKISRSEFRDQYLLITFWATWSDSCRAHNDQLKKIYKTYPPKTQKEKDKEKAKEKKDRTYKAPPELAILGISLDMDKTAWKETIKQDTLKWEQLNDLSGWGSTVVKQYAIDQIPYNILTDNRGRIIARGIKGKELEAKLDSLLKPKK
ncbi:TlpA disulfide reductase family protein [Bacteroides sp. 51]|uniref:TlpA disulfide reductase family protein n=1 Tax=Bacteroides sp. 51 TaxID=2302938 RepID=UPI0013D570D9|nr:TlpA disulfide reductase family protein [Bacteroides sp. 51]NDV82175.1 AhpC/TSA family protein [Bacteroides sp. 51]